MANGDDNRFISLLGGALSNPLIGLGTGLLAAPRGSTFGQALGQGVQFASGLQQQSLRNDVLRESLRQRQVRVAEAARKREAIGALQEMIQGFGPAAGGGVVAAPAGSAPSFGLTGSVTGEQAPGAPAGALSSPQVRALSALAAVAPEAAGRELIGLLAPDEPQEFQTTPAKLAADFALAESRGDTRAMAAIHTEVARRQAEAQSARRQAQRPLESDVDLGDITRARNDFIDGSDSWLETRAAFDRMQAGFQQQSAAGDVSLVFSFMKALDPGSVVREGEQATARNAGGVSDRIRNVYNGLLTGESLTPKQRADFLGQGRSLLEKANNRQAARVEDTRGFATRNRLPVEDVVPNSLIPEPLPEIEVPSDPETGGGRTLENPLTPREREELENLRGMFGGG